MWQDSVIKIADDIVVTLPLAEFYDEDAQYRLLVVEPACWLMTFELTLTCARIVSLWLRIHSSHWFTV